MFKVFKEPKFVKSSHFHRVPTLIGYQLLKNFLSRLRRVAYLQSRLLRVSLANKSFCLSAAEKRDYAGFFYSRQLLCLFCFP